jgi:hypothetical protein
LPPVRTDGQGLELPLPTSADRPGYLTGLASIEVVEGSAGSWRVRLSLWPSLALSLALNRHRSSPLRVCCTILLHTVQLPVQLHVQLEHDASLLLLHARPLLRGVQQQQQVQRGVGKQEVGLESLVQLKLIIRA